mgnify:CR=1 FL=1|jgi:hypothetical protein
MTKTGGRHTQIRGGTRYSIDGKQVRYAPATQVVWPAESNLIVCAVTPSLRDVMDGILDEAMRAGAHSVVSPGSTHTISAPAFSTSDRTRVETHVFVDDCMKSLTGGWYLGWSLCIHKHKSILTRENKTTYNIMLMCHYAF